MSQGRAVAVLHVHSGNLFGGVERILETLAGHTPPDAPMTSAFALCFGGRLQDTLGAAGAVVHQLGEVQIRRPDQVWRARRTLRAVLARNSYDVAMVHSSWSQAIFGPVLKSTGTPLVRWFHAPDPGPRLAGTMGQARSSPALALCNSRYTLENARARLADIPMEVHYPLAHWPVVDEGPSRAEVRAARGSLRRHGRHRHDLPNRAAQGASAAAGGADAPARLELAGLDRRRRSAAGGSGVTSRS